MAFVPLVLKYLVLMLSSSLVLSVWFGFCFGPSMYNCPLLRNSCSASRKQFCSFGFYTHITVNLAHLVYKQAQQSKYHQKINKNKKRPIFILHFQPHSRKGCLYSNVCALHSTIIVCFCFRGLSTQNILPYPYVVLYLYVLQLPL